MTVREAEVLDLVARHLTNAEIAQALVISERTVETHVSAMLRKLGVPDRRSLARHAAAAAGAPVDSGRGRLPVPVTDFIGRAAERSALAAALADHRLVTATGPGGIGKTRLALAVAAGLAPGRADGAVFVDLSQVRDPAMVDAVVAEAVGVPEQQTTSVDLALVASLARRDTLLVIDNCEHVLTGVRACVHRIVSGCPGITVLATSRIRLLLPYERVYQVPGLSVEAGGGDAVDLFAARVTATTGDVAPADGERVAALCEALDGMALAIELAAARFAALGLDGLEAGLDERMRYLTAAATGADRHSSLRAAIGWSYDLLAQEDRTLLAHLAVFASWFEVGSAGQVTGLGSDAGLADGLARLAEHSLLAVERGDTTRYRLLETIRQFGIEQLERAGELDRARAGHERYVRLALADLRRTGVADIDATWCAGLDRIVDDAGAAISWSAGDDRRRAVAVELASELAELLFLRGRPAQAQRRYEQAAELAGNGTERVRQLRLAAGAAASRFAGEEALRLHRMAADAAVASGDPTGAVRDLATIAMYLNRAPGIMASRHPREEAERLLTEAAALSDGSPASRAALAAAKWSERPDREDASRARALAEAAADDLLRSIALDMVSYVELFDNDIAAAVRVSRERLTLLDAIEVGPLAGFELADGHLMAAEVDLAAGDLAGGTADSEALASLPFFRDEDHLAISRRLLVDALAGHHDDVIRTAERFRAGWERSGRPIAPNLARVPYAVAMVHGMRGDDDGREAWVRLTLDLGIDPGLLAGCALGWAPVFDGLLALHLDDPAKAVRRLTVDADDAELFGPWAIGPWRPWYAAVWAEAAVLDNHPDATARLMRSSALVRDNPIAAAMVERARALAAGDQTALAGLGDTFARLGCPYQQARTLRLAGR